MKIAYVLDSIFREQMALFIWMQQHEALSS